MDLDKTLRRIIEPQFAAALDFSEGLAAVRVEKKFGFIDKTGKLAFTPQFDAAVNFSEGVAPVGIYKGDEAKRDETNEIFARAYSEGDKEILFDSQYEWGYVDKTGKVIIKPQFEEAHGFKNGLASVRVNGKSAYINKSGKVVWTDQPR